MATQQQQQTCLRCGEPYEEGQTVCFKCGAPIGEVKTPTQPVPILHVPRRETPAEPEPAPAPAPTSTPAGVAVGTATVEPKKAEDAPATKRRPRWPFYVLIGVLVLALVGGGVTLLRGVLAGPPVASTQTYTDPQGRFHFTRPTLWVLTSSQDGVLLTDSAGTSRWQLTLSAPASGEDAAAHADTIAQAQGLAPAAPATYSGETWQQRTGTVTGDDGVVRQVVVLVTLHGGQLYTVEYTGPLANFDSTNNLVFQPLLTSFVFDQ